MASNSTVKRLAAMNPVSDPRMYKPRFQMVDPKAEDKKQPTKMFRRYTQFTEKNSQISYEIFCTGKL